jgi:NAD(P)-dependent dehydrogenase (short-subunit alcohol dehydrogenase family)
MDLRGKVVLITGAARGIGAELARNVHRRGARPVLIGLEPEKLQALSAELGQAPFFECDVTSWDDLDRAVASTVEATGGIDVVVANAGINHVGTVETIDRDAFERVIEVDLLGVWRTIRAALPYVIEAKGYVLCIGSIYSAMHGPAVAAYTASKSGVEAFADALRVETKPKGVDVGVAYFSFLDTDLVRGALENPAVKLIRERTPWPLSQTSRVEPAVEAAVRGIEKRSRAIAYPRWAYVLLGARGVIQPLFEPFMARNAEEPVRMLNEEPGEGKSALGSRRPPL